MPIFGVNGVVQAIKEQLCGLLPHFTRRLAQNRQEGIIGESRRRVIESYQSYIVGHMQSFLV